MKHYKSLFENEQELLKAIIQIHNNGKDFECDPMYFKGNFYKEINKPKYKFDITPQTDDTVEANAANLPLKDKSINSIVLDPPFLFGIHGKTKDYYSSKTHTIFKDFYHLTKTYKGIIKEAYRVLKNNGLLVFKCQDYTDSKTTLTHNYVYNWLLEQGFYIKDLAILNKPLKIYNSNTTQRHFRKTHTYFFVAIKKPIKTVEAFGYKTIYNLPTCVEENYNNGIWELSLDLAEKLDGESNDFIQEYLYNLLKHDLPRDKRYLEYVNNYEFYNKE